MRSTLADLRSDFEALLELCAQDAETARGERDKARNDLARVTAERDELRRVLADAFACRDARASAPPPQPLTAGKTTIKKCTRCPNAFEGLRKATLCPDCRLASYRKGGRERALDQHERRMQAEAERIDRRLGISA